MKFNKSTIIKIAVAVALAVVAFFVVKYLIKKGKERADDKKREKEYARQSVELERAGAREAELTSTQVADVAKSIRDATYGPGTDNKALVEAIESIPTASDYSRIKSKYQKEYKENMWDDVIKKEVDDNEGDISWSDLFDVSDWTDGYTYNRIIAHLNKIDVPDGMR